jgi:dethiobiotin synthetase
MSAGCFVTGTDTGVGKTVVACALLRALRARGIDAAGLKPVETGVGDAGPLDAIALRDAAGGSDPLELVCPQRFALPAAPTVAAEAEGAKVDLAALDAAFEALSARHEFLVVEGAGGLLVPVTTGLTMADLAARWSLALVVVARAALGTINHTRLTLEAATRRGLDVKGLVISHADGPLSDADAANLAPLLAAPDAPLLGVVPPLAPGELPPAEALDVTPLLG